MKRFLKVFCVAQLVAVTAFAGAGDAGCGLGSLVMTKNSKVSQTLALTTNMTSYSQLFGITSGTSNCSASGFVQNRTEAFKYAEANFQNLQVEMARGEGENLKTFASLMGCSSAISPFGEMTRAKYDVIFANDALSPAQLVESVQENINSTPSLASNCAANS